MMFIPTCYGSNNPLGLVIQQVAQIRQAAILIFKMAANKSRFSSYMLHIRVDLWPVKHPRTSKWYHYAQGTHIIDILHAIKNEYLFLCLCLCNRGLIVEGPVKQRFKSSTHVCTCRYVLMLWKLAAAAVGGIVCICTHVLYVWTRYANFQYLSLSIPSCMSPPYRTDTKCSPDSITCAFVLCVRKTRACDWRNGCTCNQNISVSLQTLPFSSQFQLLTSFDSTGWWNYLCSFGLQGTCLYWSWKGCFPWNSLECQWFFGIVWDVLHPLCLGQNYSHQIPQQNQCGCAWHNQCTSDRSP